jgi:hypothetical protein
MDTYGTLESDQDVILLYDSINSKLFIVNYMAVDGVFCEPVSGPNSLLTGKNTGKFTISTPTSNGKSSPYC